MLVFIRARQVHVRFIQKTGPQQCCGSERTRTSKAKSPSALTARHAAPRQAGSQRAGQAPRTAPAAVLPRAAPLRTARTRSLAPIGTHTTRTRFIFRHQAGSARCRNPPHERSCRAPLPEAEAERRPAPPGWAADGGEAVPAHAPIPSRHGPKGAAQGAPL